MALGRVWCEKQITSDWSQLDKILHLYTCDISISYLESKCIDIDYSLMQIKRYLQKKVVELIFGSHLKNNLSCTTEVLLQFSFICGGIFICGTVDILFCEKIFKN